MGTRTFVWVWASLDVLGEVGSWTRSVKEIAERRFGLVGGVLDRRGWVSQPARQGASWRENVAVTVALMRRIAGWWAITELGEPYPSLWSRVCTRRVVAGVVNRSRATVKCRRRRSARQRCRRVQHAAIPRVTHGRLKHTRRRVIRARAVVRVA